MQPFGLRCLFTIAIIGDDNGYGGGDGVGGIQTATAGLHILSYVNYYKPDNQIITQLICLPHQNLLINFFPFCVCVDTFSSVFFFKFYLQ